MRRTTIAAIGAAIVIGGSLMGASPAFAVNDSDFCIPTFTQCKTKDIPAHSTQHWVHIDVAAHSLCPASWRVVDASNGAVVASGTLGRNSTVSQTIYGLYSSYHLTIFNSCPDSIGDISNFT